MPPVIDGNLHRDAQRPLGERRRLVKGYGRRAERLVTLLAKEGPRPRTVMALIDRADDHLSSAVRAYAAAASRADVEPAPG